MQARRMAGTVAAPARRRAGRGQRRGAARARCGAEPRVRVAVPAPAELRPARADPEGRYALVAAPRAGHREAVIGGDDLRLGGDERDALVDGQRRAPAARMSRSASSGRTLRLPRRGRCRGRRRTARRAASPARSARTRRGPGRSMCAEDDRLAPAPDPRGSLGDRHDVARPDEHRAIGGEHHVNHADDRLSPKWVIRGTRTARGPRSSTRRSSSSPRRAAPARAPARSRRAPA